MSLPLYGLLAFDPDNSLSLSASLRYLLLSFFAMAILLFGILLLYASTGSMDLTQSLRIFNNTSTINLGLILILIGLSFKISLFPFHAWAPSVYSGARIFVMSYLLIIVKSMVVIFLLRVFSLLGPDSIISSIITFMAILSMWIGSGMMLKEKNFIRILAYLSIAHLGALMIPFLAFNKLTLEAIFLDLIAFGLSILLISASLNSLKFGSEIQVLDLKGLYYKHKGVCLALCLSLISLTGFPLTAGFIGKFAILKAGVFSSLWHLLSHFILTSFLQLFVIASIIALFWQKSSAENKNFQTSKLLFCISIALLAMGFLPEALIELVKSHTDSFISQSQ
jgi:NADH-quinone oxidoreductase subunit N